MRPTFRSLVTAALVVSAAGTLQAQHEQTRDGFWISFGLGYGSAGFSCDACSGIERQSGFTSYVRLGGTLNPRVLLGGDVSAFTRVRNGQTVTMGDTSATLVFYPAAASGFFVRGGAGFAVFTESNGGTATGTGAGLLAGAGYDIRAGRNVSLTAFVDALFGAVGDITEGGVTTDTGWKQNLIHAGLGVTFH